MKKGFLTFAVILLFVISLTGCSKETKEPEKIKEDHKVVKVYNCYKTIIDEAKDSTLREEVSAYIDDIGNISGKILYKYSYHTMFSTVYDDEENRVRKIVEEKAIPLDNVYYSGKDNRPYIIKYSIEEMISEKTEKEFIENYVDKLGYECNSRIIETSE